MSSGLARELREDCGNLRDAAAKLRQAAADELERLSRRVMELEGRLAPPPPDRLARLSWKAGCCERIWFPPKPIDDAPVSGALRTPIERGDIRIAAPDLVACRGRRR
jgi:hypothetical protein